MADLEDRVNMIVTLKTNPIMTKTIDDFLNKVNELGGVIVYKYKTFNGYVIKGSPDLASEITNLPYVKAVEIDREDIYII